MSIYKFKAGSQIKGVEPQVAGEELDRIRRDNGGLLKPAMVVVESKPKKAPLHPYFTWDNRLAADQWREYEAGHLIRCLTVIIDEDQNPPKETRALVNVTCQDQGRGYMPIMQALSDEDLRIQVLTDAWRELSAWRRKYNDYQELARIFEVIDKEKLQAPGGVM